ncbi:MAG: serine/threonine protein kinase [Archangiaceae bacterium]|nr:serine/threonine protein kinase [Archangiaceae bacterium]
MSEPKSDDGAPSEGAAPLQSSATPAPRSPSSPGAEGRLPTPSGRTVSGVTDPLINSVLDDRYRIVRRLGTGGMATVYFAEHMFIGRKVAIKVLHPQLAADENFVRRFLNEGRAAGTLGHPNIIASTDMGTTPLGQPYLVLEYLEGKDLAQVIDRDGALPPVRAARVGVQVASALSAAHAAKIIHRDLKAENIFLLNRNDRRDEVRVIDFGISKFGSTQATYAGLLIGTPQYMSPEQLSNPSEVDERADVYALGVILFQMLTGRLPFSDPTIPGLVTKITNEEPPELTTLVPTIPVGLGRLVASALSKSPRDRPESMAAFEEQLARFANLTSASLEVPAADLLPARPRRKGSPVTMFGIAAVALLGVTAMVLKPWERTAAPAAVAVTAPPAPAPLEKAAAPTPAPAAPVAVAAVEPAAAPEPPVLSVVHFKVSSPLKKARVAFRGRVHLLPYSADLKPGFTPESVEVTAPQYAGRRFWVTFDQENMELTVPLTKGAGVVEASETETAVALGNAPPEALEAEKAEARAERKARREAQAVAVAAAAAGTDEKVKGGPVSGELNVPPPALQPPSPKDVPPAEVKAEPAPAPATAPAPEAAAAPPAPAKEEVRVVNPFEQTDLRNAINGQVSSLRPCTDAARKESSDFQGSVTLTMEVNGDGTVATASANAGPGNGKFAACVIRTVRKWSFPKQTATKTRMVFPLILG